MAASIPLAGAGWLNKLFSKVSMEDTDLQPLPNTQLRGNTEEEAPPDMKRRQPLPTEATKEQQASRSSNQPLGKYAYHHDNDCTKDSEYHARAADRVASTETTTTTAIANDESNRRRTMMSWNEVADFLSTGSQEKSW